MSVPRRRQYVQRRYTFRSAGVSGVKRRAQNRHRVMKKTHAPKVRFVRRSWRVTRSK